MDLPLYAATDGAGHLIGDYVKKYNVLQTLVAYI
jgi:hypothetical protein